MKMAIISSVWLFERNGLLCCHWPVYLKSDIVKDRAIQNHLQVIEEKCVVCPVRIKYSTGEIYLFNKYSKFIFPIISGEFTKARMKLQHLEVNSQTESETEQKRIPKKPIYRDYEVFSEDSDDDIPTIPRPKKKVFTSLENVAVGTPVTAKKTIENKCLELKTSRKIPGNTEFIDEPATSSKNSDYLNNYWPCNSCKETKGKTFYIFWRDITLFLKEKNVQ